VDAPSPRCISVERDEFIRQSTAPPSVVAIDDGEPPQRARVGNRRTLMPLSIFPASPVFGKQDFPRVALAPG